MFDWKSCSGKIIPYADHKIQVRGYGILWDENHPDIPIDGGYHLVAFNKNSLGFTHWYRDKDALDLCVDAFKMAKWLYDNKKYLEQL